MHEGFNYVCSNCGARCGYDGRCGDGPYLVCKCASPENTHFVDDGRGGYEVYLNGARPVHFTEHPKIINMGREPRSPSDVFRDPPKFSEGKVGWRCPNCGRGNAPDVKHCDCK